MKGERLSVGFCQDCSHYKENKARSHFAGGWWIGDGKCRLHSQTQEWTNAGFTVYSNSCPLWRKTAKKVVC